MTTKQAVLLIHGIGEQKPMQTLRGFVDAVWTRHTEIHHPYTGSAVWSKPYNLSSSFELRRLSTAQNRAGIETHFFELYWAHLMEGTSYGHLLSWARSLIVRRPSTVPAHLKGVYWLLVIMFAVGFALAVYAAYLAASDQSTLSPWFSVAGSLVLLPLAGYLLLKVVGDAARYLHVAPSNIQSRHEIREAGLAVLRALHEPNRGYDRIIIVGHSLGSVIGYDILTHAWVDFHRHYEAGREARDALDALEELARRPRQNGDDVQRAQRLYFDELAANGNSWKVTDFVTLGSPLAHSAILLANDAQQLLRKQNDREFPRCLPALETVQRNHQPVHRFSYEVDRRRDDSYRVPHHAAVFGPTRWTNLFFPCRAIIRGDLIGGPIAGVMGDGVRDLPVSTRQWFGCFSHTLYWCQSRRQSGTAPHIEALRAALDLTDERGRRS
jgi:hypothetical protein